MQPRIITGIDIGTHAVKVVIAETPPEPTHLPRIIGTGYAKTAGMRNGFITDGDEVIASLKEAISLAQRASGVTVQDAYVSYGGAGLQELSARSKILIARSDAEITEQELSELKHGARRSVRDHLLNRTVLHTFRLDTALDNTPVLGDPIGMRGSSLAADYLFITALTQHLQDFQAVVEEVGVETKEIVAAPIAASLVTLTKPLSIPGCALVDIGAETTTVTVFENDNPIFLRVFPVGSTHITHDIALGLKIPLIEAEQIKRGSISGADYPQKKLNDIISARYKEIFKMIHSYLKEKERAGLLPAGALLIGAGSLHSHSEPIARTILKTPAERIQVRTKTRLDPSMTTAYGLCVYGADIYTHHPLLRRLRPLQKIGQFFKKFLP